MGSWFHKANEEGLPSKVEVNLVGRFECSLIKEGFFIGVVYRYRNKINNKFYIGKTINPEKRKIAHKSTARNQKDPSYNNPFYRAIRKYGEESFEYSIIYSSQDEKSLLEREIKAIKEYKDNGLTLYNITDGGEGHSWTEEEREMLSISSRFKNGLLTEEEIIEIRKSYEQGDSPSSIFLNYPQITNYNSFLNIWCGNRYSHVMPEVFKKNSRPPRLKLDMEDAERIREIYKEGNKSYQEIAVEFNVSKGTIADVVKRRTFK